MANDSKNANSSSNVIETPGTVTGDTINNSQISALELIWSTMSSAGWAIRAAATYTVEKKPELTKELQILYGIIRTGQEAVDAVINAKENYKTLVASGSKHVALPDWTSAARDKPSTLSLAYETLRPWAVRLEASMPGQTPVAYAVKHWIVLLLQRWDELEKGANGQVETRSEPAKPAADHAASPEVNVNPGPNSTVVS